MYDDGYLADGMMIEWLKSHTNVIFQPSPGSVLYRGINPYALGFAMYTDIKRICEGGVPDPERRGEIIPSSAEQLAEDRAWFPDLAGTPWLPALHYAMQNFKDEVFISQYLSPYVMRKFRLFSIIDDAKEKEIEVEAIHDEMGYRQVRESLSFQYNLNEREPNIQVLSVNIRGDRSLTLRHVRTNHRPLHEKAKEVLKHAARLWGFKVRLESVDDQGVQQTFECLPPERVDE
jgi:stage V sporulation protein R